MLRRIASTPGRLARPGALAALAALAAAPSAVADDRMATPWQIQAGTAPLLQAPPPPEPVTICVIDTGVNVTPDLNIVDRRSLVGDSLDDAQALPGQTGHGTAVAHFAAGKVNGWGGAGAFPGARVTSVRVFPSNNGGAKWQDYVDAIDYCQKTDAEHIKVITISLGGQSISANEAAELENRINVTRDAGNINVVVAAGNGGGATDFPGRFAASFTVAAVSDSGALCTFSARGVNIDIAAPGCNVEQGGWNGQSWLMNGTSFATPIVGGALAAVRAYAPDLRAVDAEAILLRTARPGPYPRLNLSAALRAIGRGDIVDTYRPGLPDSSPPAPLPRAADAPTQVAAVASLPAVISSGPRATASSVPTPRLRITRKSRGRVLVRAINRPKKAILELRVGSRTLGWEAGRFTLRVRKARSVRARYLTDDGVSAWVKVPIRPR